MIYNYIDYIVIGSGSFTNLCAKFLKDSNFKVTLIESNFEINKRSEGFSIRNKIPYLCFKSKNELTIFLKTELIYVFNLLPQFEQNLESGGH